MTRQRNIRLTVAFDGTGYHGWQIQKGLPTIQGILTEALEHVACHKVTLIGSGRTDAGTHARGLIANFRTTARIAPRDLRRALNGLLPEDIRVLAARRAPAEFHARYSAHSKIYQYQIYRGEVLPPHLAREHYHYPFPIDVGAMTRAATLLVGSHDFRSFARSVHGGSAPERSTVRSVFRADLRAEGRRLLLTIEADGFLHHMARNIAGTLLELGRGRIGFEQFGQLFEKRDRRAAGFTAPARGLVLVRVRY
ncbi:MAG: tRNA pseudouridine(38-40) synthase TruA [Acidobacteria bacterium]|nr:MAG: tRNA pseudouridine(38-40) synthase TruA [Acidobacteriota bacterium]